ncbi:MAG: hypothetical protein WBD29_10500, partial [Candidatus Competibacter sp.]
GEGRTRQGLNRRADSGSNHNQACHAGPVSMGRKAGARREAPVFASYPRDTLLGLQEATKSLRQ